MTTTINLFSYSSQVEYLNLQIKPMIDYCLDLENNFSGVEKTNAGGWQSDNLSGEIPQLNELFKKIIESSKKFRDTMGFKKVLQPKILNLWININYQHCYNVVHTHPGSIFSGVFYLQCNPSSGNLVFVNPYDFINIPQHIETYNEYNSAKWLVVPEVQKLVMFPSYLRHYVDANKTLEKRISVSFNIGFEDLF